MATDRHKAKGRRGTHTFVQLRHDVMRSENFATLTPQATKLLIDLLSQYNGRNNGDLCMAWTFMYPRGWRSKKTLYKARDALIQRGWIILTRQGGRHCPNLYAVTWLPIDECNGKLDVSATRTPSDDWKIKSSAPYRDHIGTPGEPITDGNRRQTA